MSLLPRIKKFTHEGRQLEVRAIMTTGQCEVRVYENGKTANDIVYTVCSYIISDDMQLDLVGDLIETAMSDFIKWSSWLKRQK